MKKVFFIKTTLVIVMFIAFVGCSEINDNPAAPDGATVTKSELEGFNNNRTVSLSKGGFMHGIVISVDGDDYYFAGAPDGLNGATDIPGHYWVQASSNMLVGKHYNTGPFGNAKWWSSDAPDGVYLYKVKIFTNGREMKHRQTSADRAFKNGFGKLYLLR